MAGLVVTIEGKVGASYRAALEKSLSDAKVTGVAMHEVMIADINRLQSKYSKMDPKSASGMATYQILMQKRTALQNLHNDLETRSAYTALKTRQSLEAADLAESQAHDKLKLASATETYIAEENSLAASYVRRTRMSGKARAAMILDAKVLAAAQAHQSNYVDGVSTRESMLPFRNDLARAIKAQRAPAQQAAAAVSKAEQLAQLSVVARGFGAGARNAHGGGSPAGVIQEFAVIGHEILQGRGGGRILGSISILGQRLGWLRKLIKTTADAEVDAAEASKVLSVAAAAEALALEEKALATIAANGATSKEAVADVRAAEASRIHALALEKETAALAEKAAIATSSAKMIGATSLAAIAIGVIAVVVSLGLLAWAYKKCVTAARELNLIMSATVSFDGFISAIESADEKARAYANTLFELANRTVSLADKSQMAVDKLKRTADALKELTEAQKENKLASIDLALKTGKMSHIEAIKQRAAVEKKALADSFAQQGANLEKEKAQRESDLADATKAEKDFGKAAEDAETAATGGAMSAESRVKINMWSKAKMESENPDSQEWQRRQARGSVKYWEQSMSPEENINKDALFRQAKLGSLNASESAIREKLTAAQKVVQGNNENPFALFKKTNSSKLYSQGMKSVDDFQTALDKISVSKKSLIDSMTPAEREAAIAKQKSTQATSSRVELTKSASAAAIAVEEFQKNSPTLLATKEDTIDKKTKLELLGQRRGPDGLNSMQKLGAFTAQAGNPLIPLHQTTNHLLASILAANRGVKEYVANKQGEVSH
jgi:hypothetical protein